MKPKPYIVKTKSNRRFVIWAQNEDLAKQEIEKDLQNEEVEKVDRIGVMIK